MTLKHAHAELKTKQAEVKNMDSGYKKDQDNLQAVRSTREKLQAELAKLKYEGTVCLTEKQIAKSSCNSIYCISHVTIRFGGLSLCFWFNADGKEESLLDKRRQLSREVANLKETYERRVSRFPNLRFDYK